MIHGACLMLRWCVDSWAVALSCQHSQMQPSGWARGPSGWMRSIAQAVNQGSPTADIKGLDLMTVVTKRMLVLSVKVTLILIEKNYTIDILFYCN